MGWDGQGGRGGDMVGRCGRALYLEKRGERVVKEWMAQLGDLGRSPRSQPHSLTLILRGKWCAVSEKHTHQGSEGFAGGCDTAKDDDATVWTGYIDDRPPDEMTAT